MGAPQERPTPGGGGGGRTCSRLDGWSASDANRGCVAEPALLSLAALLPAGASPLGALPFSWAPEHDISAVPHLTKTATSAWDRCSKDSQARGLYKQQVQIAIKQAHNSHGECMPTTEYRQQSLSTMSPFAQLNINLVICHRC